MKLKKIPAPEDYIDIERFEYKLAKAYSEIFGIASMTTCGISISGCLIDLLTAASIIFKSPRTWPGSARSSVVMAIPREEWKAPGSDLHRPFLHG